MLLFQWPANHSVDVDRRIYVSWNCGDANDKVAELYPSARMDVTSCRIATYTPAF